jgi:hypothetical protein
MKKFETELRLSREMSLLDATMIGVGAGGGLFSDIVVSVRKGSRQPPDGCLSRPLLFLHSFYYLPPSRSWRIHEHGYVSPFFSYVRPLASAYCAAVIGRFFKDAPTHPPSIRYLLSLTLSIVAQAKGSGRQG